jgi:arsenate reductase (thioredoxin)
MKTVIFACVHNACRSQMAAAFFNKYANPKKAKAVSAGTEPASKVHPEVLTVMGDLGFDLSSAKPNLLTEHLAQQGHLLITMGCGEKCPYVPGLQIIDWKLEDPKGKSRQEVIQIRDQITNLVLKLIREKNWD